MIDRDKVISRLQIIRTWAEVGKNYNGIQGDDCLRDVVNWIDDALVLLKEQEPRVLTLEELRSLDGTDHFVWLEDNGEYDLYDCYAEVTTYQNNVELNTFGREVEFEPDNEEYGKTWRCWSARPSDTQRRAVMWDTN